MKGFRDFQLVWRFGTMSKKKEVCWLCGGKEPNETIKVGCETPGGKPCKTKEVQVHFGCLMDMDY